MTLGRAAAASGAARRAASHGDMRRVLNGILYLVRSLPHDLPPWGTVHSYYRRFRLDGTWQAVHDRLRPAVRARAGRDASTLVAVIDTQSVKTTEKGSLRATTRQESEGPQAAWDR